MKYFFNLVIDDFSSKFSVFFYFVAILFEFTLDPGANELVITDQLWIFGNTSPSKVVVSLFINFSRN